MSTSRSIDKGPNYEILFWEIIMKKRTHVIIMKIREGLNGVITGYHSCLKAKEAV